MQRIQQKWGQQAIQSARIFHPAFVSLQTGYRALDQISGGVPRGHISVWSGVPTCGMSTLTFHLMAQAQQGGENVVYIDRTGGMDGASAVQCGVSLEQLLLVEVDQQAVALAVLREVIASRVVGLVIVNLLEQQQSALQLGALLPEIRAAQCAVLFLLPAGISTQYAQQRLQFQRKQWLRIREQVAGCLSTVTVQRRLDGRSGDQATLLIPLIVEAWQ
jgi:hypothetical protein